MWFKKRVVQVIYKVQDICVVQEMRVVQGMPVVQMMHTIHDMQALWLSVSTLNFRCTLAKHRRSKNCNTNETRRPEKTGRGLEGNENLIREQRLTVPFLTTLGWQGGDVTLVFGQYPRPSGIMFLCSR